MQDYNNKNIKIIYYEMTNEQMNNPQYKNHLIKSCKSEYIVFINSRYTNGEEIEQVIAENEFLMNYDMVIFGENILQGDIHFNMLINYEVDLDEYYSTSKKPKHEIVKEIMKEFDILDGCRTLVEQQIEMSKKLNLHLKNNIKNTRVKNLLKGGH